MTTKPNTTAEGHPQKKIHPVTTLKRTQQTEKKKNEIQKTKTIKRKIFKRTK
jgi:hypothetical protein